MEDTSNKIFFYLEVIAVDEICLDVAFLLSLLLISIYFSGGRV